MARRADVLASEADRLRTTWNIEVRDIACDLAGADLAGLLPRLLADAPPRIAIYNAARSLIGGFLAQETADLVAVVDTNVRAPLVFTHLVARAMADRGGGNIEFED